MIPFGLGNANATATATSSGSTAGASFRTAGMNRNQVRVAALPANVTCFLRFGAGTQTAVTTDAPILPGTVETFTVPPDATHFAIITASGSATVYVTPGEGE